MNIIVMDANSLAWLCRLELGTRQAIEWLSDHFYIKLTKTVFEEAKGNIPHDEDDASRHLELLRSQIDKDIRYYEGKFDSQIESFPPEIKGYGKRIDKGERTAGILALKASRCSEYPVILITDDKEAEKPLARLFQIEKIGLIEDSFEIVCYMWSRNSNVMAKRSVNKALLDLKNLMAGGTTPTEKFKDAKRQIERMTKRPN